MFYEEICICIWRQIIIENTALFWREIDFRSLQSGELCYLSFFRCVAQRVCG